MRNLSYENEYDLHSNGLVSKTHFHMKGFALGLVLKQRQKRTRKWPIINLYSGNRGLTHEIYQVDNPEVSRLFIFIDKSHVIDLVWKRGC